MKESEFPFHQAAYAWLRVDINDDWKNKLRCQLIRNQTDEETLFNNQEILK